MFACSQKAYWISDEKRRCVQTYKHINLHRLLSLRGENFRWADLVSGNLKEEKEAHSAAMVHLGGPLHRCATHCIDTPESRFGTAESGVPSCTFGGKASTNARLRSEEHT